MSFSLVTNLLFILFFTNGLFAQVNVGGFYVAPNAITSGINTVVATSTSSNDAFVYVSKNTLVAGMHNLHVATTKTKNTTFYVKQKTVFHAEKNTHIKVVYISDTKTVHENEKVVTTFKKPALQLQQTKQAQLQVRPVHKLPFKFGYFTYYGNNVAILLHTNLQNAKVNTTFKYKTSYTVYLPLSTVCHAVSISHVFKNNNFLHKTSKFNLQILKTNFGRPPPVV